MPRLPLLANVPSVNDDKSASAKARVALDHVECGRALSSVCRFGVRRESVASGDNNDITGDRNDHRESSQLKIRESSEHRALHMEGAP